jgi:NAD(P)-dependent dehydrogenase (short-subunit alcohol dehydrogenase family)
MTNASSARRESAVVTGGARGIGRAVATALVRKGYAVVLCDLDGDAAAASAAEIGAAAGVGADVREESEHGRLAGFAAGHGRLAVWVNNAGVGHDGALTEVTSEEIERLVGVNLLGVTWGMRAALEAFGSDGGDIINIASLSGLGPVPGLSVYAATKAAVVSLSGSVSVETPGNVRVHAVLPDGVATPMVDAMRPDGLAKALVHSGGGLLTADHVAEEAVALIGSSRIVRSLPGWRGGVMRITALAPSVSMRGLPLFRALGSRVLARSSR